MPDKRPWRDETTIRDKTSNTIEPQKSETSQSQVADSTRAEVHRPGVGQEQARPAEKRLRAVKSENTGYTRAVLKRARKRARFSDEAG